MSGFSILAHCVPEVTADDVGPRTTNFAGVDKDTYYKWRYRVKKWKITIPYNASSSGAGGSASAGGSISNSNSITCTNWITDEVDLVCNAGSFDGFGDGVTDFYSDSDSSGESSAGASGSYYIEMAFISASAQFYDDLYYFSIYTNAQISAYGDGTVDGGPGGTTIKSEQVTIAWLTPGTGTTEEPIDWLIDGQSFSSLGTRLTIDADGGRASAAASASFGTILVEPIEYWPYDPGDGGGPVWDSSTGAQLRDPFSVQ